MQKTISPIDNQIYIEREYHSDKIEETLNNSVKAQTSWGHLSVKERVELLKKFVEDFLSKKDVIAEESIIGQNGKKKIRIPVRGLKEYRFIYGNNEKNKTVGSGGDHTSQHVQNPQYHVSRPDDPPSASFTLSARF